MDTVISNEFFGVNNGLLVVVDEWHVTAPSIVPDRVEVPRENLNFIECWLEFLQLGSLFISKNTKRVKTRTDERHRVTKKSFPA